MTHRHLYELMLTCAVLVGLVVFLMAVLHIAWPAIAWAVLAVMATVVVGLTAQLVYALVCVEFGYYTEEEISKRTRKHYRHEWHPLRALLHTRTLRPH